MKLTSQGRRMGIRAKANRGGDAGFSLMEAMVAVTLLAVIITGLTMMFNEVKRTLRRGGNQVDILDGGRATMNLLVQTLEPMMACMIPGHSNLNFYAGPKALDTRWTEQALPGGFTRLNVLEDLFALRRQDDSWRTVQFGFDPAEAARGVATLYMKETAGIWAPWQDVYWISDTNRLSETPAQDNRFRRVADGVVHLRVTAFDTNGVAITQSDPGTTNRLPEFFVAERFLGSGGEQVYAYWFHDTSLPASVEVELGLLESQTVAQFNNIAELNLAAAKQMLATNWAGKVHLFRQRIPIRAQHRLVP